jgi:hypothetical protein
MLGPNSFERNMRLAILVALVSIVVVAPLVGVFALSPLLFVWGLEPYQLAAAIGVMLAEALAIAVLVFLSRKSR